MVSKKRARNNIKMSNTIIVIALFLFAVMMVRAVQLSLSKEIDGVNLKELASKRTTKTETLSAKRGTIYDRNGEVLAQNVSSYKIIAYLDPKRTEKEDDPKHVVDKEKTARELSPILGIDYETLLGYLNKEGVYQTEFGSKGKGLTEMVKDQIVTLNLPGIDFIETQKRYYPKGDFLSYALGYAKVDEEGNIVGELGLEKYYDDILKGVDGFITYQKDLRGYKIANTKERVQEAQDGKDIYLTIDSNIQFFVEQAVKNSDAAYNFDWMTMVIADAKTGEILASTSTPSFDPNVRDLTNYLDPLVSFAYEPGSTMKIFTYMAAMENGVYDGNATFLSGTYETSDKTIIGDWDRNGWGWISYDTGFTYSSNVGIVNLIDHYMNAKMLRQYFLKLGFGSKTGMTLPQELSGKIQFKYETEIYNAGFGQGITTTPIQNIQALTSLTNDGMLLKPYIISKIVDHHTEDITYQGKRKEIEKVASTETVNKMKYLMNETVNGRGNTTGIYYHMDGYSLIGKTGTAQIADENGNGYLQGESDVIVSFAGIYPMDDPDIIIYTSVKRPQGGSNQPIVEPVRSVVQNISKYMGRVENPNATEAIETYVMPSVMNQKVSDAVSSLQEVGMVPVVIGDGDKVIRQFPFQNTVVSSREKVFLVTSSSSFTMPNLVGYSSKEASTYLSLLGIPYRLEGNGYVLSQSIPVGTPLSSSVEVVLTLAPKFEVEKSSDLQSTG